MNFLRNWEKINRRDNNREIERLTVEMQQYPPTSEEYKKLHDLRKEDSQIELEAKKITNNAVIEIAKGVLKVGLVVLGIAAPEILKRKFEEANYRNQTQDAYRYANEKV